MRGKKGDRAIESAMRFYLILLLLFVASYFLIHSVFVFAIPTNSELATRGFVCSYDALRMAEISPYCPFVPIEKLKDFGYNADVVWTGWSIAIVKFLVLGFWIASFYALAFFLAAFVVSQQNKGDLYTSVT